jgi:hypothetical protein
MIKGYDMLSILWTAELFTVNSKPQDSPRLADRSLPAPSMRSYLAAATPMFCLEPKRNSDHPWALERALKGTNYPEHITDQSFFEFL